MNPAHPGRPRVNIHIKPRHVTGPADVSQMRWPDIMRILHDLDDAGMTQAAAEFKQLGEALQDIAERISKHAKTLSDHWEGGASTAALRKFKEMFEYAVELSAQAKQTGNALEWLGRDVMPHYKYLPSPTPAHYAGHAAPGPAALSGPGQVVADEAARRYLTSLSHHIQQANAAIPSTIAGLPSKSQHRRTAHAAVPAGGPGSPAATATPPPAPPGGSAASAPSTGSLQGYAPPPGTAVAAPTGFTPAGPGGAGASGTGAGVPVGVPFGAASGAQEGAGSAGSAAGAESEMGMPLAGGVAGQPEGERQRQAWERDDNDIWGLPDVPVSPVIE